MAVVYIAGDITTFLEGEIPRWDGKQWVSEQLQILAVVDLAGGNADDFSFNWQNPHAFDILVLRVLTDETTPGGTAGALLDIGVAANTGVHSDNLIDGMDANLAGLYDNIEDKGDNGKSRQIVNAKGGANDYITGQIMVAAAASLAGKVTIIYTKRETA